MKAHLFCLMLVVLLCTQVFAVAATTTNALAVTTAQTLTFDEAKALALRDHPSLEAMRQRVSAAAATVRIARSAYWPTLAMVGASAIRCYCCA